MHTYPIVRSGYIFLHYLWLGHMYFCGIPSQSLPQKPEQIGPSSTVILISLLSSGFSENSYYMSLTFFPSTFFFFMNFFFKLNHAPLVEMIQDFEHPKNIAPFFIFYFLGWTRRKTWFLIIVL